MACWQPGGTARRGMTDAIALLLGGAAVVMTGLSLLRAKVWWIRIWDFPRVQVATLGTAALAMWVVAGPWRDGAYALFTAVVALAVAYQTALVWRYTRLAPREVQRARNPGGDQSLSLVVDR